MDDKELIKYFWACTWGLIAALWFVVLIVLIVAVVRAL